MNPLAITPAFTGEIEIPEAAIKERDQIVTTSKQITAVDSDADLARSTEVIRDLNNLKKAAKAGKQKYTDAMALVNSFFNQFLAPVNSEHERVTELNDAFARKEAMRKQAEERERQGEARKAQDKIDKAQAEIAKAKNAKDKLAAQLKAEEASMAKQAAQIVPVANTPQGLATRVSYDFEIVDAKKLISQRPELWTWKAGEEAFHFRRSAFRASLNSDAPSDYHAWRPPEDTESVVMSEYGVRVFVSVKTNVRS